MVNPRPVIILDGAFLSCEPAPSGEDGRPVLALDRPTLVEDFTITWGRKDQWTQPEPSVLTFKLWEPWPGEWLTKIIAGKAMRRGVAIVYNSPVATTHPARDIAIFQGFTTDVDVTMSTQRTAAGLTAGWMVSIQASDRSAFLGQINWGNTAFPEESMQNRAVRIRNQGAPIGIRELYFESRYAAGTTKAFSAQDNQDKSVLDSVNEMYKSFADQWCYNPARNTINRIPTGSTWGPYDLKFGKNNDSGVVRIYPPAWQDTTGTQDPIDKEAYTTGYIGACQVSGDIVLSANTIQDITEITCKWWDKPSGGHDWTTTVKVKTGDGPPARLQFDSWFIDGRYVDPVIEDVRKMVVGDGSRPTHPEIRWDTSRTGDVPDWTTFESLVCPAQTIRMVTLAGSPFSSAIGYAPVWHPSGGVIRYAAGKWDFTIDLAPTSMPLAADHTPVTPNELDPNLTLDDPNGWRLDHSITPFDLYYVGEGTVYPAP